MLVKQQQARYRPMVKKAWEAHCAQMNISPNNSVAYQVWYQDKLMSTCGIRSTTEATEIDYKKLMNVFTLLSEESQVLELTGLTDGQNHVFCRLVEKAWQQVNRRGSVPDGKLFHEWLNAELEKAGVHGNAVSNKTDAFEDVMSHFAIIAGDDFWMSRTAEATERRMRYKIKTQMAEIERLYEKKVDWDYIRAVYEHMNLPLTIEEADAAWLWKIIQALQTYIDRKRKEKGEMDERQK